MSNNESYMRTPQAAEYLGVKPATLAKWRHLGRGPKYTKAGSIALYSKLTIDEWAAANTVQSTAEVADAAA